jgi:hypothetical protein
LSIPFVPTVRAAELRWWHGYLITYHSFNDFILLREILLDQYERVGLERGYIETLRPDHPYRTVREGSSWEGGGPIQLPCIPLDSTIANNYRRYRNSAGIETDSVRNPPRPAKQSRIQSDSDSLFGEDSELSESSEDI